MSKRTRTKLVPQSTKAAGQILGSKEDTLADQLDAEIECPRCNELMELLSKFDDIRYFCRSCHLELTC